jgi:hypothetical protein
LSGEPTILAVEPASFQGPEQPHFEQRLLFCQVVAVGIIVGGLAAAVLTEATAQCDACLVAPIYLRYGSKLGAGNLRSTAALRFTRSPPRGKQARRD